jgi:DNA end-binding protein Ku
MALRSTWEGYLRLNLISVPVKAYSATTSGGGKITFHQLCEQCHSRIKYKKVCPVHGELTMDQIDSGYEVAKDEYTVVEKEDLEKLRPEADKSINIDVFVRPESLDAAYYTDRTYYLVPDGKAGQKPYAVLQKVMAEEERQAVATMVLSGKEQVVLIRPVENLLALTVLNYDAHLKKPSMFADEVPEVSVAADEVKLAKSLVETSTTDDFDMSHYSDEYTERVLKLIDAKSKGKRIVSKKAADEPVIINLMDALKKSLAKAKSGAKREKKPHRRKTG